MGKFRRAWLHHRGKSAPVGPDVHVDVTMDNEEAFIDITVPTEDWIWSPGQRYDRITHWRYSTMRPLPEEPSA